MRLFNNISANTTDLELVKKFQKTLDQYYLEELYNRYAHLIFVVLMKYVKSKEDAEDISVELYEVFKDKLPGQNITNVGGWIYTVTKNQALMQLRSMNRNKQKEIEFVGFMEIEEDEHQYNEEKRELDLKRLNDCIGQLNKEQKKCVELFYKQEKCYREVANLTGYELKKVKSHLQNGKRNLKNCMGG
ncbi:MAG: sigma-70 family RNA polymerase sigma factor [Bacteroidota bacterium]